ncbi:MAG TPA: helix-turn-helix domain-containing protein [Candidatus Dojkabacteria bacterium]
MKESELSKIAESIGSIFSPFCEVVIHKKVLDQYRVIYIINPQTNREVKDSIIFDEEKAALKKYRNSYTLVAPNGKSFKSNSTLLEDDYIFSIHLEISSFSKVNDLISNFINQKQDNTIKEQDSLDKISKLVKSYTLEKNKVVSELSTGERKELIQSIQEKGFLDLKGSVPFTAKLLGLSRTSIYNLLNSLED